MDIYAIPDHGGKRCSLALYVFRHRFLLDDRHNITILHGSKVSRESDLHSVPYNRTVFVRSIVKNVKSLSENQHNS